MSNLENSILYIRIKGQNRTDDGICVQNDILVYMPQLHGFTVYFNTSIDIRDFCDHFSREGIQ
jgi:hypothetical protein